TGNKHPVEAFYDDCIDRDMILCYITLHRERIQHGATVDKTVSTKNMNYQSPLARD
ncbi:hypothetical protein BGZ65_002809, partial [Modicella reniformis]